MRVESLQDGYAEIGAHLLEHGERTKSRASGASPQTREIMGFTLDVEDPRRSLPVGTGRKLNNAIGAIEALQLVGGWSDPELQCRVSSNMRAFMDAGAFHGAYGLRVASQVPMLIDRLRSDHTSRQGVITIWDPSRDSLDGPKDLPCTVSLQFINRKDTLHAFAYMRSNDFWWGLAYDVFQFTQLQMSIAHLLDLDIGQYHHFVGSFHTYERDWELVKELHAPDREHPKTPGFTADADKEWADVRHRTRALVGDCGPKCCDPPTIQPVHAWYFEQMRPYTEDNDAKA